MRVDETGFVRRVMQVFVAGIVAATVFGACGGEAVTECTPTETVCDGACTALSKDPENCGACGVACSSGTVCYAGACTTSCGGGTIACGQSCVDVEQDHDNCGACDQPCPKGLVCNAGACSSTCADEQVVCVASGVAFCVNTMSDNANCGGCGVACASGKICSEGQCASTCADDQTLCESDAGAFCATTSSDNANCGGCGEACELPAICTGGKCTSLCADDQSWCGSYCTDVKNDSANCGSCGNVCTASAACASGKCACVAGYSTCGSSCVDLSSDLANCGSCNAACSGTCALDRCASVIAPTLTAEVIAVDASYVYGAAQFFERIPKDGSPATKLSATSIGSASVMAIDATNVYAISATVIFGVPLVGGAVTHYEPNDEDDAYYGIASDGTNLYYSIFDGSQNRIEYVPIAGGNRTSIVTTGSKAHGFVIDTGRLYWSDATGIYSVDLDGSNEDTIYSGATLFDATTDDDFVYAITSTGSLLSIAKVGHASFTLATSMGSPRLAADGTSVYAFNDADELVKIPRGGGSAVVLASEKGNIYDGVFIDATRAYWNEGTEVMELTPR
jgi:hypothetical protein